MPTSAEQPAVVRLAKDRLEMIIRDLGAGFDLNAVDRALTSPDELLNRRGCGSHIMRSCMDSVEFQFGPSGTLCTLIDQFGTPQ